MVAVVERASYLRRAVEVVDVRGRGLEIAKRMGILAPLRKYITRLAGMSIVDIAFAHAALVSFIYRIGKPLACQWHIDSDVLVHSITLKDYLEFE